VNKIKTILYFALIQFICLANLNAEIKDSLFISVGNKAITKSDIVHEIKMILILNNQTYSEDKRDELQSAAVQSAIKRNLKKFETEKYDSLEYNVSDLENELKKIANNMDMDLDTLEGIFLSQGLDFEVLVDSIKTDLLWNTLIFKLYNERISINLEEIEDQLANFETSTESTEYLLSELVLEPVQTGQLDETISKINEKIKSEGFEKTAMDISIADTGFKGGDIGWVDENIIIKKIKTVIEETPVGSVTKPIFLEDGIVFFNVRDKKKTEKKISLDDAKNQLINAEKTKILSMHSLSHYNALRRSISIKYY
tara:strand:+ start:4675 stop:5610 length:936 start_codon:yes stop_codon:yes gene_type:complete